MSEDGFLSRWSRRKADVKAGRDAPPEPMPTVAAAPQAAPIEPLPEAPPQAVAEAPPAVPAPTLDEVNALKPGDGIARFVARGVDEAVKRAAVKKLFADPHFNIMDGLDIYIDDYGKPDPIPASMLRELNQSKFMKLFADEEQPAPVDTPAQDADAASAVPHADEDPDLQLQPDDPARREGA